MPFREFVATRLSSSPESSVEYKASSSFLSSIDEPGDASTEEQLRSWIAHMIDRGFSLSTRERYIKKLSAIYREYSAENDVDTNPFDEIKELLEIDSPFRDGQLDSELDRLEKIFHILVADARKRPELALFLYLLLNASTDIENAISLTVDDYRPEFHQLDEVIDTAVFHHSRKYVFDLKQSRRRMPQLVREVESGIDLYMRLKGIGLRNLPLAQTIQSFWILQARKSGVRLSDIKGVLGSFPEDFQYLGYVHGAELSAEEKLRIKHRVAEAFFPSGKRWYAMKVRRGFDFDSFRKLVRKSFDKYYDQGTLFYPMRQAASRVGKKIVTVDVPVIPDVVFFHVQPRFVRKMDALVHTENIGWIFRYARNACSDYSVIDTGSMTLFQQMIGVFTADVKIELTPDEPVGIGRDVIITGGIMAGYRGRIYDIKQGSDVRQIYIRLSEKYAIRAEAAVEEFYVRPIDDTETEES